MSSTYRVTRTSRYPDYVAYTVVPLTSTAQAPYFANEPDPSDVVIIYGGPEWRIPETTTHVKVNVTGDIVDVHSMLKGWLA